MLVRPGQASLPLWASTFGGGMEELDEKQIA